MVTRFFTLDGLGHDRLDFSRDPLDALDGNAFWRSQTLEVYVEGEVVEVLEGFGLAHLRAPSGKVFGLSAKTPGIVDFAAVKEGQRYRCRVARKFARVLRAELLA